MYRMRSTETITERGGGGSVCAGSEEQGWRGSKQGPNQRREAEAYSMTILFITISSSLRFGLG